MIDETLYQDVLEYLQMIGDVDVLTERNIKGYIARGMNRLNKIAGKELDFESEGMPRALLLDYCRYANSQALEVFERNFRAELLDLNLESQVEADEDQNAN